MTALLVGQSGIGLRSMRYGAPTNGPTSHGKAHQPLPPWPGLGFGSFDLLLCTSVTKQLGGFGMTTAPSFQEWRYTNLREG